MHSEWVAALIYIRAVHGAFKKIKNENIKKSLSCGIECRKVKKKPASARFPINQGFGRWLSSIRLPFLRIFTINDGDT